MRGNAATETHALRFARGAIFTLEDVKGLEIRIGTGAAWLTQSGQARDIVLGPGEALRFEREGRVVIQALRETTIAFHRPAPVPRPRAFHAVFHGFSAAMGFLRPANRPNH